LKIDKLLAGIFAFIMVASMVFPAYAIERVDEEHSATLSASEIDELLTPTSHDNVIYENANPDTGSTTFIDTKILADDFVLAGNSVVTDAHFIVEKNGGGLGIEPLLYFIFADNGGVPGDVIESGTAQDVQLMFLADADEGDEQFEVWFDFEDPVPLDGGVTYWFGLKYTEDFGIIEPEPEWIGADVTTGHVGMVCVDCDIPPDTDDWRDEGIDFWFQLTGDIEIVGGEFVCI